MRLICSALALACLACSATPEMRRAYQDEAYVDTQMSDPSAGNPAGTALDRPHDWESTTRWEDQWHGHVSFPIGARLGDDSLGDSRNQATVGFLDLDIIPPGSGIGVVLQMLVSYTSDVIGDGPGGAFEDGDYTTTSQINLGVRKTWISGRWKPYFGGGVAFADLTVTDDDGYYFDRDLASDSDFGGWVGAGVLYAPNGVMHIGLNAQYSFNLDYELAGRNLEGDALDLMLTFGVGW